MSDGRAKRDRMMEEAALRRQVDHAIRTWDASGGGGSRATSPLYGRRSGRSGPPPSGLGGTAPYAITAIFDGQVPNEDPWQVEFTAHHPHRASLSGNGTAILPPNDGVAHGYVKVTVKDVETNAHAATFKGHGVGFTLFQGGDEMVRWDAPDTQLPVAGSPWLPLKKRFWRSQQPLTVVLRGAAEQNVRVEVGFGLEDPPGHVLQLFSLDTPPLADLSFWLKADSDFARTVGGSPAGNDDPVIEWQTEAESPFQTIMKPGGLGVPTWKANRTPSGLPAIDLNSSSQDGFRADPEMGLGRMRTIAALCRWKAPSEEQTMIGKLGSVAGSMWCGIAGGGYRFGGVNSGGGTVDTNWHAIIWSDNGSGDRPIWVDGVPVATGDATLGDRFSIGVHRTSLFAHRFADMEVTEILRYTDVNDAARNEITAYLMNRGGLT